MLVRTIAGLAILAVALSPLACGSAEEDPISSPDETGSDADELKGVSLDGDDNGKSVTLTQGQNLTLRLKSNPTTGYKWRVTSTDRTFGYPATDTFVKNGGAVGSGGTQRMVWKTKGTLSMVGSHTVKLEYARETGEPAEKFAFTVKVVEGSCPDIAPPAPGFCKNGRTVAIQNKTTGCTTSYDCVEDCRTKGCGAGRSCMMCWANFACVPDGAMC